MVTDLESAGRNATKNDFPIKFPKGVLKIFQNSLEKLCDWVPLSILANCSFPPLVFLKSWIIPEMRSAVEFFLKKQTFITEQLLQTTFWKFPWSPYKSNSQRHHHWYFTGKFLKLFRAVFFKMEGCFCEFNNSVLFLLL